MLKKYTTLMVIGLIINLAFSSLAFAQQDTETRAAAKVKIRVVKFGIGNKLTEVKLKDKTKVKGYITEIKEDYFVLVNKDNAASTNISYNQVKSVGRTFPTALKVLTVVGATLGVIILISAICVANGTCVD